jgi:hypothetical protein
MIYSAGGRLPRKTSSKLSAARIIFGRTLMVDKFKHTRAEEDALLRDLEQIFKYGDEREFMQVLRKNGIMDEDPRFVEILKLFRALRGGKT